MERIVLCLSAVLCLLMSVAPGCTLVQINASEQNAIGEGCAWGYFSKGCLLSSLCLIVKIYMGDNVMGYVFIVTIALRLGRL